MIDVFWCRLLAQPGKPQPHGKPLAIALQRLAFDQHGRAVLEAEISGIGVPPLLPRAIRPGKWFGETVMKVRREGSISSS